MEMRCYRMVLSISFKDNITDQEVRNRTETVIGPYEDLCNGMVMSHDQQVVPKLSGKAL